MKQEKDLRQGIPAALMELSDGSMAESEGNPLTHVYFVRHAQPVHSHQEDRTRPLTQEGKEDAALVTKVLADKGIDCFYSSPYLRSLDTIRPAAAFYSLPIQEEERFRERQAGEKGNAGLWEENSPCAAAGRIFPGMSLGESPSVRCSSGTWRP